MSNEKPRNPFADIAPALVTREELIEVITHLAFYSGWPTASSAITIARKVFAEA